VLLGNGDGTFQTGRRNITGRPIGSIELVDLDGDGVLDLVGSGAQGLVSAAFGNGKGQFGRELDYPTASGPSGLALADVNRDGKPDLITTGFIQRTISVLLGNGKGRFQPSIEYPVAGASSPPVVADVNRDGQPDIVLIDSRGAAVLLGSCRR